MNTAARWLVRVLRAAAPLALLAGGIASLAYGIARHTADVSVEQEIEVSFEPPGGDVGAPGFVQPGFDQPPGFVPPGADPNAPPPLFPPSLVPLPPELSKVKEKVIVSEPVSEVSLIREVTFGGVTRKAAGVLWRTYTGAPPSLCPT